MGNKGSKEGNKEINDVNILFNKIPARVWRMMGDFRLGGNIQTHKNDNGETFVGVYDEEGKMNGAGLVVNDAKRVVKIGVFKDNVFAGDTVDYDGRNLGNGPFTYLKEDFLSMKA